MHIYNFEKNRKKIKNELQLRLIKRREVLNKISENYNGKCESEKNYDDVFDIKDISRAFSKIENKIIGTQSLESKHIYKNISNKKIEYSEFINCDFNNIKFENCNFFGSDFNNCRFNNVYFSNCNFVNEENTGVLFENNCIFSNCTFYKSNINNCIFESTRFINMKIILSSLRNSIINDSKVEEITFIDCNLKYMKIISTDINILSFEDEFLSKVDENTFFDLLKLNRKDIKNYENIYKTYKSISSIFERNGLFNYSGEYYYLSKIAEKKYLKGIEKVKSTIFYYTCGYGERPTFALISSMEIVLIFAIIYMFSGLCVNERIIHYSFNIIYYLPRKLMYMDLIDCFYFSLVTFTSVGYGDIFPIGYSVLLSCIEMILGVTMLGVWTATLARKITR